MALTCPNCGRDVTYDGGAEAICAACPGGGPDGDTHFSPDAGDEASTPDAPAANQVGSERDPAWVLPEHGVTFTSQAHIDGARDLSQELPAHGVEGRE